MFGYIKPHFPELLVKQADFYKAMYCGLCKCLGSQTGCLSRLGLNYDFVFLALVRSAVTNAPFEVAREGCVFKCARTKNIVLPNEHIRYAAAVGSVMMYHKIRDNVRDEKFVKSCAYSMARPAAAYAKRRARNHDLPREHIVECLSELAELEKLREPSVDRMADVFGRLLAGVASYGIHDPVQEFVMKRIGHHIGRWIYIMDAADDYEKDVNSRSYNPFVCDGEFIPERIMYALEMELVQIDQLLKSVEIQDDGIAAIIENILHLGMFKTAKLILSKSKQGEDRDENERKCCSQSTEVI